MSNSIKKNFPICQILMCYYHLKANISSHNVRIPELEYLNIMTEISNLHMRTNIDEYQLLLETKLLFHIDFHQYFKKQWVDADFNNWQIFKTFAG